MKEESVQVALKKKSNNWNKLIYSDRVSFFLCTGCEKTIRLDASLKDHCYRKHKTTNAQETEIIDLANKDDTETEDEVPKNDNIDELDTTKDNNVTKDTESSADKPSEVDDNDKECDDNEIKTKACIHFTRFNNCKHGISGKSCKYEHPKTCPKYLKNGDSKYGCSAGKKCKFFHPKLCRGSLAKVKICTNVNCKYVHLKGTKRSKDFTTKPAYKITQSSKDFLGHGQRNRQLQPPPQVARQIPPQPQLAPLPEVQRYHQLPPPPQIAQQKPPQPQLAPLPEVSQNLLTQPQMMTLMMQIMNQMMLQQQQHPVSPTLNLVPTYANIVQRNTV